eukprot:GSMAST32.ASY1.ANO1.2740.1 assembled CDS
MSAGDALREVDRRQIVKSDPFVLVSGDVVSNINLRNVVEVHKTRRKKDSSAIMTMVFKPAAPTHPTRQLHEDLVINMNLETNQILGYEDNSECAVVNMMRDTFREHSRVSIRHDLLDCHIDVCSPEVLEQFSANYDYQDIRKNYVHNEVVNIELGWKYYGHIVRDKYAARVQDLRTYDAISRDIIHRWTFPVMPDSTFGLGASYSYHRCEGGGGYYREQGVSIARGAKIGKGTVLGAGCSIGEGAYISQCVMGCLVGDNANVRGSYLWDSARIDDNAQVFDSVICNSAHICKDVIINSGSIISFNCVVRSSIEVPKFTRITLMPEQKDEFDSFGDFDEDVNTTQQKVKETAETATLPERVTVKSQQLRAQRWNKYDHSLMKTLQFDKEYNNNKHDRNDTKGDEDEGESRFRNGVRDYILHGIEEGHTFDEIGMELKSFKHSEFKDFTDCVVAIVPVIIDLAITKYADKDKMQILKGLQQMLNEYAPLISFFQVNSDEEPLEDSVYIGAIYSLEEYVLHSNCRDDIQSMFGFILQFMWESDITTIDAVTEWAKQREEDDDDVPEKILFYSERTQKFLEEMKSISSDEESEYSDSDSS